MPLGNPPQGHPDKSQIKVTGLQCPGQPGWTHPQSKQSRCPSQMQVWGVGLPSCAIQCHAGTRGVLPPASEGAGRKGPWQSRPSWDKALLPPLCTRTCPPSRASWAGAGRVTGGGGRTKGRSGCGGCQGAWGTLESGPQAEPWSLTPPQLRACSGEAGGGLWEALAPLGLPSAANFIRRVWEVSLGPGCPQAL